MTQQVNEPQDVGPAVESKVFMIEGELRDAWGNPVDEDEEEYDDYDDMKVEGEGGLKEELKRRQEAGREFDTSNIKTKADLITALREDDAARAQE